MSPMGWRAGEAVTTAGCNTASLSWSPSIRSRSRCPSSWTRALWGLSWCISSPLGEANVKYATPNFIYCSEVSGFGSWHISCWRYLAPEVDAFAVGLKADKSGKDRDAFLAHTSSFSIQVSFFFELIFSFSDTF